MRKILKPAERLIVAADFKPPEGKGRHWVRERVLELAQKLNGTGVYLKVNSALRACGYDLIYQIQLCGVRVFADLKLYDISETLGTDGSFLAGTTPDMVTTVCATGAEAMRRLKEELPDTEVLGVTVLTSLSEFDVQTIYGCSIDEAVLRLALVAADGKINGLICSPKEATVLREKFGSVFSLNTPGIRPAWFTVTGDDQNQSRVMTPAQAIQAGADRIVVGRPITQADNPYDAVMRTIDEIASAMAQQV